MGWDVTRRNFLYTAALLSSVFTAGLGSIGALLKRPSGEREAVARENPFTHGGRSLVSVAGGGEVKPMVARAVAMLGGFEMMGLRGLKVLVKPNVVSGRRNPTTTNPEVVRAVVELLLEAGASEVWVGDMSALTSSSTRSNMEEVGIRRAAEEAGARVVYFEDHGWYTVPCPKGRYLKDVAVTEWLYRVDRIVNLPVIKTHRSASYSICLKNFVGCTHMKERPYFVDRSHWEEVVSELNLACRPDLNIVDGTVSMVEGGPWKGREAPTNLVMASGDRVAADVVGLGVIKSFGAWAMVRSKGVWEQRQIRRAVELGLGAKGAEDVELLTASLKEDPEFEGLMEKARGYLSSGPEG
ncbi:MAG: DUF362 domain-containing protein [Nitrospirota bacterium]|jgi:uncharacterized protein (DUF362 family)